MTFEAPGELLDDCAREATLDEIQAFGVSQRARARLLARLHRRGRTRSAAGVRPRRPERLPGRDVGPARPPGRLDRAARDERPAHAHRAGAEVGDEERKRGHVNDPSAKRVRQAGRARWRPATATASTCGRSGTSPTTRSSSARSTSNGKPHTPRALPQALLGGRARDPRRPRRPRRQVLFGETAPIGNQNVVSPLGFLRGALCLNTSYKKEPAARKLRIDGYAHHAYTRKARPDVRAPRTRTRSASARCARLDRRARQGRAGAGAIDARTAAIYLTEFGIQSKPDPIAGVSLAAPGGVPRRSRSGSPTPTRA